MIEYTYEQPQTTFWEKVEKSEKFQENGLWGLRTNGDNPEVVLPAQYDQIEICTDFIFLHWENQYEFRYRNGSSESSIDSQRNQHIFYKDGYAGLKDGEGKVLLPAQYDKIVEWGWGRSCDVIYVRRGNEFHYYNHAREEILTDVQPIAEDQYPLVPFSLGEDQCREVLLCVEPIEKPETARDCYAYNQWVRLTRIPYKAIREIFEKCDIVPVSEKRLTDFYDWSTYIYSARRTSAQGKDAIMQCIEKFESLGCYNSSWGFMTKICVNHNTKIDPHDLYNAVYFYQVEHGNTGQVISIGYDDSLSDGEVSMFQVHYFSDSGPGFLNDTYTIETIPDGTIEEVIEGWDKYEGEYLNGALYRLGDNFKRPWETTKQVADFLYSKGMKNVDSYMSRAAEMNFYQTAEEFEHKLLAMEWALNHGANINLLRSGTYLSHALDHKNLIDSWADEGEEYLRHSLIDRQIAFLKEHGALMPEDVLAHNQERVEGLTLREIVKL